MPRRSKHRKLIYVAALGMASLAAVLWHAYDARQREALVRVARGLGGHVTSVPFLWAEELRIHFDKAPRPEVLCRELTMLNRPGPFRTVSVAVPTRDLAPEDVAHLRECLGRCTVICVEDAE